MFKPALVQMRVEPGLRDRNVSHAVELIAQAAANGGQVIVLPETMDVGWTDLASQRAAQPIPDGHTCRQLATAARDHKVYVCAGVTESAEGKVYNSAVLIDPAGEVVLLHRKLNELEIAHACYAQGDRLGVCHTEYGTIGIMICADGFAKDRVIARALCYMGADVILSPSAWAVPADHDNEREPYGQLWRDSYVPVAREFGVWIVGVSNVGPIRRGPWAGRKCIGCSLVIDPGGNEVLQGPYGEDAETILYVDIEPRPRPARGDGWEKYSKHSERH